MSDQSPGQPQGGPYQGDQSQSGQSQNAWQSTSWQWQPDQGFNQVPQQGAGQQGNFPQQGMQQGNVPPGYGQGYVQQGQQPYDQQAYVQPGYDQFGFGGQQYGQAPMPPVEPPKKKGWILPVVIGAIVLVVGLVLAWFFILNKDSDSEEAEATPTATETRSSPTTRSPTPTPEPEPEPEPEPTPDVPDFELGPKLSVAQVEQGFGKLTVPGRGQVVHHETLAIGGLEDDLPEEDGTECPEFFASMPDGDVMVIGGTESEVPGTDAIVWVFLYEDQETAVEYQQLEIECIDIGCCYPDSADVTRDDLMFVSGASFYSATAISQDGFYTDINIRYGNTSAVVRLLEEDGTGNFDPEEITRLFVAAMG